MSEAHVVIRNRRDFEEYPWPDVSKPIDFHHFETAETAQNSARRMLR